MNHSTSLLWQSGSGDKISFTKLIKIIQKYSSSNSKVFVGTDSFVSKQNVIFASAICLHGGENPSRYFFFREKKKARNFKNLGYRIIEEARRSVEIAEILINKHNINIDDIELHLDVSPFHLNNETSKFSSMLKGYVAGYGIECKLKPDAWASQTVADRHSK